MPIVFQPGRFLLSFRGSCPCSVKEMSITRISRCTLGNAYHISTAPHNAPLQRDPVSQLEDKKWELKENTYIFNIPALEQVLPRRRKSGLNPSEERDFMIR